MTFRIVLHPSGRQYEADAAATLLSAGLQAGVGLQYSCRTGNCRTCRGKVVQGTVAYDDDYLPGLTAEQRADGFALLCKAKPLSDLVIEVQELSFSPTPARLIPCRVKAVRKITPDVAVVTVRLPMNENMMFAAGQFVDFLLEDGQTRSYSIATVPQARGVVELELHVRHMPGGLFTDRLFTTEMEGGILKMRAPLGSFFVRTDADKPIVLLASGTGFAPIKSMVEHAQATGSRRPMRLYWGGRTPADLYMDDLARQWSAEIPGFEYVPVVSDASPSENWGGRAGWVHQAVMQDLPDLSGWQVYACGAPAMVDAARRDFTVGCGLPEDEFFADSFLTAADRCLAPA